MPSSSHWLGLPEGITACLFDLDGVLTRTAVVHDAAWAETFDAFLRRRADGTGEPYRPFDQAADYNAYVDGRPRVDGVRAFLASRGIALPDGTPDDPPGADTVFGLARRKDELLAERIRRHGVAAYPDAIAYLHAVRRAGLRRAVVSASAHCREVLAAAHLDPLIEATVDGVVAAREGLRGKPYPDTYRAAAGLVGVPAGQAAVFEDAEAGVQAGRDGGFGYVVGIDRVNHRDALLHSGASIVVTNLKSLIRSPVGGGEAGR